MTLGASTCKRPPSCLWDRHAHRVLPRLHLHSPVLAVYCRLPRFLNGDSGLLLAAAAVPAGRLEDMFPGWVRFSSARRAEWVRAAEDGAPESYGVREEEKKEEEEEERRDVSTDAGSLRGLQSAYVWVCVRVCVYMCACVLRASEQGFPVRLVQCGAAEHPSAAKQPPDRVSCPSCSNDTHIHTRTHARTRTDWAGYKNTLQRRAVLLLPWQPQMSRQTSAEGSCVYSSLWEYTTRHFNC